MTNSPEKVVIVWFRQDLRLHDHSALKAAVDSGYPIILLYIYDDLKRENRTIGGAQQWWLYHSLTSLNTDLNEYGNQLTLRRGNPVKILQEIISHYDIQGVYWSRCYEPYAINRDTLIKKSLKDKGIDVHSFNNSLLFEPWTILNQAEQPYKVFSQFWKSCLKQLDRVSKSNQVLPRELKSVSQVLQSDRIDDWKLLPTTPNWAREFSEYWTPGEAGAQEHLQTFIEDIAEGYKQERNYPGREGTSRLSPHLHFGEISPQQILHALVAYYPTGLTSGPECYLKELGWREFCHYLLYHYPHMVDKPFRADFETINWDYDDKIMQQWQQGLTGFPIVDAGLRQLWRMGWMHNRVRMIVASFLTKDLFMDWKDGERWFWDTLVDADLANNVAGWQWVAGCGADAAPYFRVFNPYLQSKKFDSQGDYIRKWVPELANLSDEHIHEPHNVPAIYLEKAGITLGKTYPKPIVDHYEARERALKRYKILKKTID